MKAIKWLKKYGPSVFITFIIAVLVIIAQFPYLAGVISFVFADCVIGYWYKNKIIINKAMLKAQATNAGIETEGVEKKFFNSDYYDLYYDFDFNQLMIMLKSTCLAFSLCPILCDLADNIISYIGTGMTLAVCLWAISAIVSLCSALVSEVQCVGDHICNLCSCSFQNMAINIACIQPLKRTHIS